MGCRWAKCTDIKLEICKYNEGETAILSEKEEAI
jgi:hypothetical protein